MKDYLSTGPLSEYEEEIELHIIKGKRELEIARDQLRIIKNPKWDTIEAVLYKALQDLTEVHQLNKLNRLCAEFHEAAKGLTNE